MKKTITIYELLGKVKDNKDSDIYVKYMNRMTEKEDTMWACIENIIYKLDNKVIYLNDEVEILDEEEFEDIEEIETSYGGDCKHRIFESNGVSYEVSPTMKNKINQLIKNQKKIIERLKER